MVKGIPFTADEFFGVFARYNTETWPASLVLAAAGWAVVLLAALGRRHAGRIAAAWLALLWLWMGVVYHLIYFRSINPIAAGFGAAFILQAALLFRTALRGELRFTGSLEERGDWGTVVLFYGLLVYPWIGTALGHRYPAAPTFGVPCPTTIYTLGLLLWSSGRIPVSLLIVPTAWTIIAASATVLFGVWQDLGLPAAMLVTIVVAVRRSRIRSADDRVLAEPAPGARHRPA